MGQSDRAQSMKSSEPEADHLISDQPHSSSIVNKNEPIADPSTEETGIAGMSVVCHTPSPTENALLCSY